MKIIQPPPKHNHTPQPASSSSSSSSAFPSCEQPNPATPCPSTPGTPGPTFIFLIGASATHHPVPCALLSRSSPVLAHTIRDAASRRHALVTPCAYLPDCDASTFHRFLAFLHTGDFPSPLFRSVPPSHPPTRYRSRFLPPAGPSSPRRRRAWAKFVRRRRYAGPRLARFDNDWEGGEVDDEGQFALCAVVRVYLLAARYEVAELVRLCLHKLHRLIVSVREIWDGVHFLRLCARQAKLWPWLAEEH
ncbi:BTB/POZ fold protein [Cordyceps fumosorosea ARSEF 2679]|uniref:BTB/POZ fold protein n=1 Tax=Cordyceps fumosorosea (strain ARSEF 2679) TaxID=1081104 RepID=A0A168CNV5_CORFA|nr:BTB/POZ fold protein [Cordyceps fumosorosea ARSEF 2679]OAA71608.1 BTB/POZ fold protein [Cordyceps fumosorosea ARSEF 2679]